MLHYAAYREKEFPAPQSEIICGYGCWPRKVPEVVYLMGGQNAD